MNPPFLVAVMGPTASGKSEFAETLASEIRAQLINADAFQIYRGMDIGTAKPTQRERYELLDIKDPNESFGVGEYVLLCEPLLQRLYQQGRSAVVVGGTGLYVRALFSNYRDLGAAPDPELRARLDEESLPAKVVKLLDLDPSAGDRLDLQNPARVQRALERLLSPPVRLEWDLPPFTRVKFALNPPSDVLHERIGLRVQSMVHNGWVEEVRGLGHRGFGPESPGFRAIGYRAMLRHTSGEIELEEAMATTIAETRSYAKRQRTWLRSEPDLIHLNYEAPCEAALSTLRFFE